VGAALATGVGLVVVSPLLSFVGAYGPVMSGVVGMVYAVFAFFFLLGVLLPAAIYWYMGGSTRQNLLRSQGVSKTSADCKQGRHALKNLEKDQLYAKVLPTVQRKSGLD